LSESERRGKEIEPKFKRERKEIGINQTE